MQQSGCESSAGGLRLKSWHPVSACHLLMLETGPGYRGWLVSFASVYRCVGHERRHSWWSDFRKPLLCASHPCTPQNVQSLHQQALGELHSLQQEIARHYHLPGART